jgi:hypothetical protein
MNKHEIISKIAFFVGSEVDEVIITTFAKQLLPSCVYFHISPSPFKKNGLLDYVTFVKCRARMESSPQRCRGFIPYELALAFKVGFDNTFLPF